MSRFRLRSRDYIDEPDRKRTFNEQLFTAISREYPWMTRVLSFGRDARWKRDMIASLSDWDQPVCVDLACGNGDLTYLLAERYPSGSVLGLDLTEAMLRQARERGPMPHVEFRRADMCETGLPPASCDVVTAGYALRNAPRLDAAITEVARMLKPGGEATLLDFSRPDSHLGQRLELAALRLWGGFWGLVRSANPDTYRYITDSLDRFPTRSRLHAMLEEAGLEVQHARRRFFGVIDIILVRKKSAA